MSATRYAINDCYASIQGEGCQTGVPMIVLRLHGCPVGCYFCDTKETWERDELLKQPLPFALQTWTGANGRWVEVDAADTVLLVQAVRREAAPGAAWVLITGGEPAMQDLTDLATALRSHGFKVALETSGTHEVRGAEHIDWLCVSPKFGNPGGLPVRASVLRQANEIKVVVGKLSDISLAENALAMASDGPVGTKWRGVLCLQPVSQSPKATALCIDVCKQLGWRLSLQTHKFAGLP